MSRRRHGATAVLPQQGVLTHDREAGQAAGAVLGPLLLRGYLDRVNVGFAALTMNKSLGITPEVFGSGAGTAISGSKGSQ
jgi:hypothetical protein